MPNVDPFRDDDDLDETDLADEDPWGDDDPEFDPMSEPPPRPHVPNTATAVQRQTEQIIGSPPIITGFAADEDREHVAQAFEEIAAARGVDEADVARRREALEALESTDWTEAQIDQMMTEAEPVEIVGAPLWKRPPGIPENITELLTVEQLRDMTSEAPVKIVGPDGQGIAALAVVQMLPAAMGLWMIHSNMGVYPVRLTDVIVRVLAAPRAPLSAQEAAPYAEVATQVQGLLKGVGSRARDDKPAAPAPLSAGAKLSMGKATEFFAEVLKLDSGWRPLEPIVSGATVTASIVRGDDDFFELDGEALERIEIVWTDGRVAYNGIAYTGLGRSRKLPNVKQALMWAAKTPQQLAPKAPGRKSHPPSQG